ncbi:Cleavage stimulation factor subunit 77 [Sarracenia purpurea var. burkii]
MADKYDVEAAEILANEALHLPISVAVPIYEQLLATFPTAAKYWKQYVEAHMAVNNDDATKQIFSRCLLNCLQIPLWRCYIRFIRKANEKKAVEGQEETRKAFDFMLSYVGADIASGPVWMEYITFLKSIPAQTTQEESQRMTAVRKAYQKAIVTPTHHVEQLWKDYENFENSVSRALAKGLLSEYQPKYNSARAVYRERKKYVDEIDWDMLAVPPSGSHKEELQWMAWKRFLAFEKGNPQRMDSASANKRIAFTYEQCLMFLYHYPDIWYDYATWHANSGAIESAIKVFHRALKALPDSEMLRYAFAELEESRGAIQPAKKVYESLVGDGVNATALTHIQYIRFLRRTEGVEAARKYFLDARKSPNCTYHVFVAYAMMAFCLDKDPKVAHNVFEAGLKRFMHEPGYILEYADFLSRLNDDRNIRALFERALSSLPPEESVEVWKRFIQFEQTYGDLASMLKVEQRRKEALSRTGEESQSALESSLHDVAARYSFMDLWPCSSKDLDHLARQEWISKNVNKKVERPALANGATFVDKGSSGLTINSNPSAKVVYPDTSRMVIYDPRQKSGPSAPGLPPLSSTLTASSVALIGGGSASAPNEFLKATPPALLAFITNLPAVEAHMHAARHKVYYPETSTPRSPLGDQVVCSDTNGPSPDIDFVLSVCLQSNIPTGQTGKPATSSMQLQTGPAQSTSDLSGSSKPHPVPSGSSFKSTRDKQPRKRRDTDRKDDDETATVQSQPLPRDMFKLRQLQKARGATSQTGSASYGSAFSFSGELSGSTG